MKKIVVLFTFEWKKKWKFISLLCVIFCAVLLLYMSLFGAVKEMMLDKMDALPPELLAMFGMMGDFDLSDYYQYFAMVFQIVMLIISVLFLLQAIQSLHQEEKEGTIEFLASNTITRAQLLAAKICSVLSAMFVVSFFCFLPTFFVAMLTPGVPLSFHKIFALWGNTLFVQIIFIAIGFLLASVGKRHWRIPSIGIGIFFFCYLMGYLSSIGPSFLSFLKSISPLELFSNATVLRAFSQDNQYPWIAAICYLVFIVGGFVASFFLYRKKDLS